MDYIFEKLTELEDMRNVVISTNLKFGKYFQEWLDKSSRWTFQGNDRNRQIIF